jgi:hypothetical protein
MIAWGTMARPLADEHGERGKQDGLSMKPHQRSLRDARALKAASRAVESDALPGTT